MKAFASLIIFLISFTAAAEEGGGKESSSDSSGVEFGITYKGEYSNVMRGGLKQKSAYLENLDIKMNLDTEKLLGLKGGSLFLYGLGNKGSVQTSAPTDNVGDIQGTSNIQTPSSQFILYEAWYQHLFYEDKVSLLVGMHDLNSEFYALDSAGLFFNASFGVGKEISQTGANGPSIFPVTSLAARLKVEPVKNFYIQTAVFNAQAGDANDREATHIRGFGNDGTLAITEMGVLNSGDHAMKLALGLWSYDRTFEALNDDTKQVTSKGSYVLADYHFSPNVSIFAKYGRASTESNSVGSCLTSGLQWQHLFSEGFNDRLGLGVAKASFGKEYFAQKKGEGINMADSETTFEISYRFELTPWLAFQPDFQYVINPSGDRDVKDAEYGAIRIEINL